MFEVRNKASDENKKFKLNDFVDDPITILSPDPLDLSGMFGFRGTWADPQQHLKWLGLASGGPVRGAQAPQQMDFSSLGTGQLVAMASSPLNAMEYPAVLAELGKRMKAEQTQVPGATVLDELVQRQQTTQASQSAAPPGNPIASGIATMQQQAPARMRDGGPVLGGDINADRIQNRLLPGPFIARSPDPEDRYVPQPAGERRTAPRRGRGGGAFDYLRALQRAYGGLDEMYDDIAEPYDETPEEALATARAFRGEDRLAPFSEELEGRRKQIDVDYRRAMGPNLIATGAAMMGSPTFFGGLARGGTTFAQGLNERSATRRKAQDENFSARYGIATAQQRRDDQTGDQAARLYGQGVDARSRATQAQLGAASDISSAQGRDANDAANRAASSLTEKFRQLLEVGYTEEEAKLIVAGLVGGGRGGAGAAAKGDSATATAQLNTLHALFTTRDGKKALADMPREQQEAARDMYYRLLELNLTGGRGGGSETPTTERSTIEAPRRPSAPPAMSPSGVRIDYSSPVPGMESGSTTPGWERIPAQ